MLRGRGDEQAIGEVGPSLFEERTGRLSAVCGDEGELMVIREVEPAPGLPSIVDDFREILSIARTPSNESDSVLNEPIFEGGITAVPEFVIH